MAQVPESVRSRAWAAAKPAALDQWHRTTSGDLGGVPRMYMLTAASRAVDAALAAVYVETDADVARRRLVEEFHFPTDSAPGLLDHEAVRLLGHEERMRYLEEGV